MFDLTTYVKKWRIRQLKTVFSTLDTLCGDDDDIDDGTQAQEKRVEDEQRAAAFAAEQHKCREAEMRER